MVLELYYSKLYCVFLRQDSQSSNSFGKIQNVRNRELSEECYQNRGKMKT